MTRSMDGAKTSEKHGGQLVSDRGESSKRTTHGVALKRQTPDLLAAGEIVGVSKEYGQARKGPWGMPMELSGEEGRGKLRKAAGRSKHPVIRRSPNGVTRPG